MFNFCFKSCKFYLFIFAMNSLMRHTYGIDPFSHIKITSNKATCQKSKDNSHIFIFNYIEKVNVILADGSIITSENLEIILDSNDVTLNGKSNYQSKKTTKSNNLANVKKITFKNNVHISNKNRIADSNSAIINLLENTCLLDGNVKIKQVKISQKDIPLDVESSQALINLKTSEITLLGSHQNPVSTIIELGKNIIPQNKNQNKK